MKFDVNPFHLYPIKGDLIDKLFINRDNEISSAKGILNIKFKNTSEIVAIIGGTGIGKSSLLYYIFDFAEKEGKDVGYYTDPKEFILASKENELDELILIDNGGKLNNSEAQSFYNTVGGYIDKYGGIIFFCDTYERNKDTLRVRKNITSQNIALPKKMKTEDLTYFIENRMKKCLIPGQKFIFPFEDDAINMASLRSLGNLRNFIDYTQKGWFFISGNGNGNGKVGIEEMKIAIEQVDRSLIGNFDLIDLKILWYSTTAVLNKNFLSQKCGINVRTLESHLEEKLFDFITYQRHGVEIYPISVYKNIKDGKEILEKLIEGLGIDIQDITDEIKKMKKRK